MDRWVSGRVDKGLYDPTSFYIFFVFTEKFSLLDKFLGEINNTIYMI